MLASLARPMRDPRWAGADWYPQRPGASVAGGNGYVFQAAPDRLGQHKGEGEAELGHPGGEQQRAAQPQRAAQDREQEDADEGAELADVGRDAVSGGAHR